MNDNTALDGFPTLAEVNRSPDDYLGKYDVGILNVICAGGLPGAENLELAKLLDWLDAVAEAVSYETRRHWYRFLDSPATYRNSPGYFCCYLMLQVLQEDFGVRYNPARIRDSQFSGPEVLRPRFQRFARLVHSWDHRRTRRHVRIDAGVVRRGGQATVGLPAAAG